MNNLSIKSEDVLNALRKVYDPELGKDLVTLNMISDIVVEGGTVKFSLNLTTPACPLREKIEEDARKAVLALPGVEQVEIKVGSQVRSDKNIQAQSSLSIKNAIAVASGKGGVGKTTVAVNMAVALAQSGAKVGLLDADIYGPNVPTMMGSVSLPPQNGEKLDPPVAYGVKVMSIGFLVRPDQPLIWRGPLLHKTIQQFINDVEWGELDYLVIDLPPGTGDAQLSIAQTLPLSGVVIVTLPQQVSIEDARRGLLMFRQLNTPILGIIENMSYLELPDGQKMEVFGHGGGQQLAEEMNVTFLGTIPMDQNVSSRGDLGLPVVLSPDASEVKVRLQEISEQIAAKLSMIALKES
jgi:ATP-binding protein involved in chromosome partitioning